MSEKREVRTVDPPMGGPPTAEPPTAEPPMAGSPGPPKPATKGIAGTLAVAALLVVPFLVYGNALQSPFVGDDLDFIQRSPAVTGFSLPEGLAELRPLNKASYRINQLIHGQAMPGYHLVNIALHAMAGVLLYYLFRRLLTDYAASGAAGRPRCAALLALAAALLFEVHPLNTQAVNYTFARSELFCAVFLFAALLVHAKGKSTAYSSRRGVAVSLLFLLALSAKERAFMFVPALLVFDLAVRKGETMADHQRRWRRLVVPMTVAVILGLVNFYLGFKAQHQGAILEGQEVPGFVPYFLTEMVVRLHYLKLFFWPADLSIDYGFTLRESLSDPVVLAALGVHLAALVALIPLWRKDGRIAFGLIWFLLFLLPTSGLVPAFLLMHEHWTYVPAMGIFLACLAGFLHLKIPEGRPWLSRVGMAGIFVLCFFLGTVSFSRNKVWQDPVALWRNAARHAPEKPAVWNNLGAAYLDQEKYMEALHPLKKAEILGAPGAASHYNIGLCLLELGRLDVAQERLDAALELNPDRPEILLALGRLYRQKGKLLRSLDYYKKAMERGMYTPDLFLVTAKVEIRQGNDEKAVRVIEEGLKLYPNNKELRRMQRLLKKEKP